MEVWTQLKITTKSKKNFDILKVALEKRQNCHNWSINEINEKKLTITFNNALAIEIQVQDFIRKDLESILYYMANDVNSDTENIENIEYIAQGHIDYGGYSELLFEIERTKETLNYRESSFSNEEYFEYPDDDDIDDDWDEEAWMEEQEEAMYEDREVWLSYPEWYTKRILERNIIPLEEVLNN